MDNTLNPGEVRIGHVIEHDRKQALPCTLEATDDGLLGHIPTAYQAGSPHRFAASTPLPEQLRFVDHRGTVVLLGIRSRGTDGGMVGDVQHFDAEVAIFGGPNAWPVREEVEELYSSFDGLERFKSFSRVNVDTRWEDDGLHRSVEVVPVERVQWSHGAFTFSLVGEAPSTSIDGQSFSVESATSLHTHAADGATVQQHLLAQWPVRALVMLVRGTGLYWRTHIVGDPQFDHSEGRLLYDAQVRRTMPERRQAVAPYRTDSLFSFDELGPAGMKRWHQLMDDKTFRRAVDPVTETFADRPKFSELRVMIGAMALDAMGHHLHGDGQRRLMYQNVSKCLDGSGIDFASLGGTHDNIATAISNLNNEVKHADRDRPDGLAMALVDHLMVAVMRAQVFDVLNLPAALKSRFAEDFHTRDVVEGFSRNGYRLNVAGDNGRDSAFVPV